MKSIWKFPFETEDYIRIEMPFGAEILCVQIQEGVGPCMWALVDKYQERIEPRRFRVYGTGHAVELRPGKYVGTYQLHNGSLVFHVFEEVP